MVKWSVSPKSDRTNDGHRVHLGILVIIGLSSSCGRIGFDANSVQDGGDDRIDASEETVIVRHGGWNHVGAVGARTPKASPQPLMPTLMRIGFSWNPVESDSEAIVDRYEVFRSETAGGPYTEVGTLPALDPAPTIFVDLTAVKEMTYYYVLHAIVDDESIVVTGDDSELEIVTPPDNMALVHRWIANSEICAGLHGEDSTQVDRTKNYRCPYTGPGRIAYVGDIGVPPSEESFYDLGAHYLVDVVELGCDYTLSSAGCPDASGSPGPCLGVGNALPGATANAKNGNLQVGNEGDVFYDRGSSICYYKSATAWVSVQSSDVSRSLASNNTPGLPPLVLVDQISSFKICESRGHRGVQMGLLSRKLQIAASAWAPTLSAQEIGDIESGTGPEACNSDMGHAGEIIFDEDIEPANFASLPGTLSNTARVLRTGSEATARCVSRYGIQDLAGNSWDWVSDQFVSSGAGQVVTGVAGDLDPSVTDLVDIAITRADGGGGAEWNLADAPMFILPLGVPAAADVATWQAAQPSSGVQLYGDGLFMNIATDGPRGAYVGGSSSSNGRAGRYTINISRAPNQEHERIGLRCAVRVTP